MVAIPSVWRRCCGEVATPERSAQVLAERLRRRGMIPGFGLRIYPDGDPRARLLLSRIEAAFPDHPDLHLSQAVCIA
ncbi:MAG: citrate/2-methylcitrate synthase [Caldilineaceae bacterium]